MPLRPPDIRKLDFSVHNQYYTFWSPAAADRVNKKTGNIASARCSFCLKETKHLLVRRTTVKGTMKGTIYRFMFTPS